MRWHMKSLPPAYRLYKHTGVKVYYKDILVGEYFVGLLINDMLLVELKTVKALDGAHVPRALVPRSNAMQQSFESGWSATMPAA